MFLASYGFWWLLAFCGLNSVVESLHSLPQLNMVFPPLSPSLCVSVSLSNLPLLLSYKNTCGTSLEVQWLRLHASNAGRVGSITHWSGN